jgi:hypothetical protein
MFELAVARTLGTSFLGFFASLLPLLFSLDILGFLLVPGGIAAPRLARMGRGHQGRRALLRRSEPVAARWGFETGKARVGRGAGRGVKSACQGPKNRCHPLYTLRTPPVQTRAVRGETRSPAPPGRKRSSGPFQASNARARLRGLGCRCSRPLCCPRCRIPTMGCKADRV